MSFSDAHLHELLPALYRIRDAAIAGGSGAARGPLRELLVVLSEQLGTIEEDLEQLHDDEFIETCAEWVVTYIGDLIGYRPIRPDVPGAPSARAEVAHTIAYRRRKGTASMLEQLARDVTQHSARVVEFFRLLGATQHMNHLRPRHHYAPHMRDWRTLSRIGTGFDTASHTVDVRRIRTRRGRFNIPNIGLFLWRLDAFGLRQSTAVRVGARRFRVNPLGIDLPLVTAPQTEDEITHIATPLNVPASIPRRVLKEDVEGTAPESDYYGAARSIQLYVDGVEVPRSQVVICDLSDSGATWSHLSDTNYVIDPLLGRIGLPTSAANADVAVTHCYAFSARMGGGPYPRSDSFALPSTPAIVRVRQTPASGEVATIAEALLLVAASGGVIEVQDNGRYAGVPTVNVAAGTTIELRARDGARPVLVLDRRINVTGGNRSTFALNGFLIVGAPIVVPDDPNNTLGHLELKHTTLVPGLALDETGAPENPALPSLIVDIPGVMVDADCVITGGVRVHARAAATITNSIVDAMARDRLAYSDSAVAGDAGGELVMRACTVVGQVHTVSMQLVSNSILLATLAAGDAWAAPVTSERRQAGCVRFSWLPLTSRVPRRYNCQPLTAALDEPSPAFTTLRYGQPAYAQLRVTTPDPIRRGADDEGEMGAFHMVQEPRRESNLAIRLDEFLRVGLDAGILYEN